MRPFTRKEAIAQLREKRNLTYFEADQQVNDVLDMMQNALIRGQDISFRGLGSFLQVTRKAKIVQNISLHTSMKMEATRAIKFKLSKSVKKIINEK